MKNQNTLLVIALIFITTISLWMIPSLIKKSTYSPDNYPFVYYSSIMKEICMVEHGNKEYPLRDLKGNTYNTAEFDSLMPLLNYRQLMANGTLPDSLEGIEITPQLLRAKSVMFRFRPREIETPSKKLYTLFESMPKRVGLEMPEDIFRFDSHIEFINAESNEVDQAKSALFEAELKKRGYTYPTQWAIGNPTTRKPYDEGYFSLDHTGKLFHLKMVNGRPFIRDTRVSENLDIAHFSMLESSDKRFYGFLFDKAGHTYILEGGDGKYTPVKLDIPAINLNEDQLLVMGNILYWTVSVTTPTAKEVYALNAQSLERVAEHTLLRQPGLWDKTAHFILPYYFTFESKNSDYIYPRIVFNSAIALLFNLILALVMYLVYLKRLPMKERIFKSLFIVITGIAGLLVVVLLPHFRK